MDDISPAAYAKLERGEVRSPTMERLEQFAEIIGLPLNDFLQKNADELIQQLIETRKLAVTAQIIASTDPPTCPPPESVMVWIFSVIFSTYSISLSLNNIALSSIVSAPWVDFPAYQFSNFKR